MPALLTGRGENYVAELYATALLDSPFPVHSPASAEKSELIDQAFSEYKNLCTAGVEVDPDAFCARFPEYETSLRKLVEVHRELEANPGILRGLEHWPTPSGNFFGFQLEGELGRGAFARVFLAREPKVGNRQVVVKVSLHADDEVNTLGKLDHPNVVPILYPPEKANEESGFAVVCMPFLGGATLLRVIEALAARPSLPDNADFLLNAAHDSRWPTDSGAPPARALRRGSYQDGILHIGERLASALAYVHERGILHRDLKPTNVLLCPNGEPKLIDFNLAYDRSMIEHRLGGTLPYMPPEQLELLARQRNGEPVQADNRSDLYALGVILYELLAGAHPFGPVPLKLKTAEAREFLLDRQRRGPQPLRMRNRNVDPALEALIARCLSHHPERRPLTAREMVAELRRLQSPIRRARRWAVANVKALSVAGVLVASGSAAAGGYVANLPTSDVVHRRAGENLYREGQFETAIKEFTASLVAKNDQPEVHAERALALVKVGQPAEAREDLKEADPEHNGLAAAYIAYCYSLRNDQVNAAKFYLRAIELGYQNNAAVYNNLAFCHLLGARYAEAEAAATTALEKSPGMRAAYYNRAMTRMAMWFQQDRPPGIALEALDDFRQAINRGATTAQAYFFAATLCAAELHERPGDPKDDPLYGDGQEFLRMAVVNGYPRKCLEKNSQRLQVQSEWARQLPEDVKVEKQPNGTDTNIRLVDPATD
jgi:eukaryotic-like serine/threonine-protein kinase